MAPPLQQRKNGGLRPFLFDDKTFSISDGNIFPNMLLQHSCYTCVTKNTFTVVFVCNVVIVEHVSAKLCFSLSIPWDIFDHNFSFSTAYKYYILFTTPRNGLWTACGHGSLTIVNIHVAAKRFNQIMFIKHEYTWTCPCNANNAILLSKKGELS